MITRSRAAAALAGIVLLGGSVAAAAAAEAGVAPTLAPIQAQLQDAAVLRGLFTQARELAELPQPLRSSGEFVFARGHGIWWHTRLPFESEFILTPARMVLADGGGPAMRLDVERQPGLRLVSQLFLALFALDFEALQRHFDVAVLPPPPAGWALALSPRDAALSAIAAELQLRGQALVERVELFDTRGERTTIELHGVVADGASLSAAELQRFAR